MTPFCWKDPKLFEIHKRAKCNVDKQSEENHSTVECWNVDWDSIDKNYSKKSLATCQDT